MVPRAERLAPNDNGEGLGELDRLPRCIAEDER
jgi:hypothetical protein